MNNETHKTILVVATMETDLSLSINVPIDTDKDDIREFIHYGNIDGGDMVIDFSDINTWRWQEPDYDMEFDPKAMNVSAKIKKPSEETQLENDYEKIRIY